MENLELWILLAVAIATASIPIVLLVSLFKWWRLRKLLSATRTELKCRTDEIRKAAQVIKKLAAAKTVADVRLSYLEQRFSAVINLDDESRKITEEISKLSSEIENLKISYRQSKEIYDRLLKEVAVFDERISFAELGVYEPHFDFGDSEEYKHAIADVRQHQKSMISNETAVFCTTTWSVDGSVSKGQTMIRRAIRLTLRAFNNECDAAIANTRWNNVNAMEKRILNAQVQIDKHNASNAVVISTEFAKSKLQEMFLTHEYREKLKVEKEERAEAARLAREEQRLIRDMELAIDEEDRYQRLLDKAKIEAATVVGPKLDAFADQIKILERDLAAAHAKVERAQALAERTRSGYVYIISNIGSFGGDIVKIGLTRRLDPVDRVRELGDASVPFVFDVHAIIYSDDAPALERSLHTQFESTRVNAQNYRKEFFRASLDEVETAVKRLAPGAPFFKDIEAQEYQETLSRRRLALESAALAEQSAFPNEL